ncbi:MAG: hypothetical protein ACYSWW_05325 [Planctomycetota bacterium]|jgi:hypothetical protein
MIRAEAANGSMIEVKEVIARVRKEAEDAMMKVKWDMSRCYSR